MSREYWFEWNGVKSTQYGIYVSEQPPITMPTERVSYTSIPGRSGALVKTEGEDVYEDLTLTVQCVMLDGTKIPEIMKWLKGSGKVTFANRQGGFYYGRVANQIPFDKVMRGRENRAFAVIFRCKPFWYLADEEEETLSVSGQTIKNEGSVISEPIITVNGTGEGTLMIGQTLIELTGMTGSITIDSELQEAYSGLESRNGNMSGDFPRLAVGTNGVSWTGGITSVTIRKNTRYL